jgi:hypothetical protein
MMAESVEGHNSCSVFGGTHIMSLPRPGANRRTESIREFVDPRAFLKSWGRRSGSDNLNLMSSCH